MTGTRWFAACIAVVTIGTATDMAAQNAAAHTRFDEPVQYALENLVSGTSTAALIRGAEVVVVPLRTWKSVDGFYCRRYEIRVTEAGAAPSEDQLTRCRTKDGVWRLVKQD
ncbi:MAG TPA: hypothetical protein VLA52_05755 [Thermohalobaculum sp.]|nr:hypothetical protein [Thermohalobaculum sp.]